MNTDVQVAGTTHDLRPWFSEVEQTLTRFHLESPLSRLNGWQGRWVVVPPLLFEAVRASLRAADLTGGAFDPTVLDGLEAAGYSRSFELGPTPVGPASPAGRWREVQLAPQLSAVRLPVGVRLDLGGIGKGLAVDGAMDRLAQEPRLLVNAGGDLSLRSAPGDAPTLVEIQDPWHPDQVIAGFAIFQGAAATSSTMGRRWGGGLHHIINPATGRPAETDLVSVTVFARRTARAEVLAKACIVLGRERALPLLARSRCHALLVTGRGDLVYTPGLEEYRYATA